MPNSGMRVMVPPIPSRPLPHGLLGGCVDVVTTGDLHELNGTDMLSEPCAPANAWQDCPDVNPITGPFVNPDAKVFDRPVTTSFEPVTAYAGVECSTFGLSFDEARERAVSQLRTGEQQVLEDFFMRRGLAAYALGNDLTPAEGALSICMGVGILETWLALNYGGVGVLHAPVGVGTLLSGGRIVDFPQDESCITTLVGNAVVLGGGYSANVGPYTAPLTPGAVAPEGEAWLYITPAMRIRRDARVLPQNVEWQSINTTINDRNVIAESTFVVEVSCAVAAAVRVNLSC